MLDFSFNALDAIAFGWNRGGLTPLHTLTTVLTGRLAPSPYMLINSLVTAARELYQGNGRRPLTRSFPVSAGQKLLFVDHHEAHAWSTYALSGFDDALVLVVDGRGARQATSLYHASAGRLKRLRTIDWPNSLGSFYEAFTDLLGFERYGDEWKVMGLAAYGEPTYDLNDVLRVVPGGYQLNARLVHGRHWNDTVAAWMPSSGLAVTPTSEISDGDRNLAASVQKATRGRDLRARPRGRATHRLPACLPGRRRGDELEGQRPAAGHRSWSTMSSCSRRPPTTAPRWGRRIAAYTALGQPIPRYRLRDVYLGPEFTDHEIEAVLRTYKLSATRVARCRSGRSRDCSRRATSSVGSRAAWSSVRARSATVRSWPTPAHR